MPKTVTSTHVLLYYPNLIGYLRVLCMVLSFYFALTHWQLTLIYYSAAFVGDVVDGHVARAFKQSSTYGGVLDMVTDRVSTCGFLVILSNLYPHYLFPIIMLIVLDIGSHWFHVLRYIRSEQRAGVELLCALC
jgi:CDP-diacylglycerol--inositol 3-phosphatidyltransferase